MSTCVVLNADGTITQTGQAASECAGYVLMSSAENAQTQILVDIFKWPEPEVATQFFAVAFGLVLSMNVAGYIVGAVVKMLSTDRD